MGWFWCLDFVVSFNWTICEHCGLILLCWVDVVCCFAVRFRIGEAWLLAMVLFRSGRECVVLFIGFFCGLMITVV